MAKVCMKRNDAECQEEKRRLRRLLLLSGR